jgi:hypothetical protein
MVNHIMEWNGGLVRPLGKGVDGAVHALAVYQNLLVVGGTFTKAFQGNGGSLRSGGLAGWRLHVGAGEAGRWELVGAPLQGAVMAVAVNASRLFVGGRFNQFCSNRFNGLAVYNGSVWEPLGLGVGGGSVMAMAVLGKMLYVGGDFSSAGGKQLDRVAAWNVETSSWHYVGTVDGNVHALLAWDGHLLAGGSFSTANDRLAVGVARYTPAAASNADMQGGTNAATDDGWGDAQLGVWHPVGRGIEGRVNQLAAARGCLYAAGDLSSVNGGVRPALGNLARYCPNGELGNASALWEPAVLVDAGRHQSLATLYALVSAIPAGAARWGPREPAYRWVCGINATNGTAGWGNTTDSNSSVSRNGAQGQQGQQNGTCVRVPVPPSPPVY